MLSRFAPHHRAGFSAGLSAGALLTLITIVLNRAFGLFSLPELVAYQIIGVMPLALFEFGIRTLRGNAKLLLLAIVLLGQLLVAGGLGALWASLAATLPGEVRSRRRVAAFWQPALSGALFYAVVLFLLTICVLLPLAGAGFLGTKLSSGIGATLVAAALEAGVYALSLAAIYRVLMRRLGHGAGEATGTPAQPRITRRQVLRQAVFGGAALALAAAAVGVLSRRGRASGAAAPGGGRVGNGGLPPEVTPTPAFYTVSKNFTDPKVDVNGWKLQIGGLVAQPYSLTLDEIRALPPVSDYRTLCCISNEVGGDLISNAGWKGVRLKDLLERAGVQPGAVDLQLTAQDGYTESFPIAKALSPDVLAVYEMNGETLTDTHGFPLRLLVPDIYGMKNVKWLTRLDVVGSDFRGFWQERGWSDVAIVKTMSRIDFPRARQLLPAGRNQAGGIAFAGARGVTRVEVSGDGGQTWREAQLRRPLGPATWALWTADLDLLEGDHTLKVRATDGAGVLQTDARTEPAPDGASGWHTIGVRTAPGTQAPPTG